MSYDLDNKKHTMITYKKKQAKGSERSASW